MATPCSNNPDEVISKIVGAKANADKFDKFVNGTQTESVQLGTGSATPVIRNIVRQMYSAAAELPNANISGKFASASGTNTILRTLSEHFGDWINVRDFGAVGDGVTDDSDAIQAALNYANTSSDNRPVVAFGTFLIRKTLNVGRPASNVAEEDRQSKPEQRFIFDRIVVDAANWSSGSNAPAINLRGWRAIMEGPYRLMCNKACAGIKIDTFGAKVLNPAVFNFAAGTYGLTWRSGGNMIFNPMINHDRAEEAANLLNLATPGILLEDNNSSDSKVFGGTIGNCSPGIYIKNGPSFNFFHGMHLYCGSSEYGPIVDPVLVRNESSAPNYLFNIYYDSGHIDVYKSALKISGGHYLNNTSISTINGPLIRCYAEDNTGNFATLNVFNIHNAKAIFDSGPSTTIPDTFDYSRINNLSISGGQEFRYERQVKRVLPNNYNTAFEIAYKPVGELRREYYVGGIPEVAEGEDPVPKGVRITYLDNAIRISDPGNGTNGTILPGACIRLGGGSAGISENPDAGGQTFIWANATVHLDCAGNAEEATSGYVRPGVDNFDLLGTSSRRWKEFWCANDTIRTSDERMKQQIAEIPEAVFRAWGKVNFVQYKWNDAVAEKGESARFHIGAIAQQIIEAFESEGLDATRYGLLCYDEWPAETHTVKVIDKEAVVDEEDRTIEPEVSHIETVVEPAGRRYSLRYGECLCLEAAYQRWRLTQIENRLNGGS